MLSADTVLLLQSDAAQLHDDMLCTQNLQQCDRALDVLYQTHRLLTWTAQNPASAESLKLLITDYQNLVDFVTLDLGVEMPQKALVSNESIIAYTGYVLKETIKTLVRFIMRIIEIIWDFIRRIFVRQYRLTRQLESYLKHFKTHPIYNGKYEQHHGTSFLPCDLLQNWIITMHKLSFDLAPVFAAFEAKGELVKDSVELDTIYRRLSDTGLFSVAEDPATHCILIINNPIAIEQHKVDGLLGNYGWNEFSTMDCIRHSIALLNSIDTLKDTQRRLKKAMVDRVADHVTDAVSHNRYTLGIKAIQQITTGYAAMSMSLATQTTLMAGIAKRYCQ